MASNGVAVAEVHESDSEGVIKNAIIVDTLCCALTACCVYSYALFNGAPYPVPCPANGTYSRRDCPEYRKPPRDKTGT